MLGRSLNVHVLRSGEIDHDSARLPIVTPVLGSGASKVSPISLITEVSPAGESQGSQPCLPNCEVAATNTDVSCATVWTGRPSASASTLKLNIRQRAFHPRTESIVTLSSLVRRHDRLNPGGSFRSTV